MKSQSNHDGRDGFVVDVIVSWEGGSDGGRHALCWLSVSIGASLRGLHGAIVQ